MCQGRAPLNNKRLKLIMLVVASSIEETPPHTSHLKGSLKATDRVHNYSQTNRKLKSWILLFLFIFKQDK
jgi:hypothetical protein